AFATKEPLRIGAGGGPELSWQGGINHVRVYAYDLSAKEIRGLATAQSIAEILALPKERQSDGQRLKLRSAFLQRYAPSPIQAAYRELIAARRELRTFRESLPTTMVMQERTSPRTTHVLIRGQYHQPGHLVEQGL